MKPIALIKVSNTITQEQVDRVKLTMLPEISEDYHVLIITVSDKDHPNLPTIEIHGCCQCKESKIYDGWHTIPTNENDLIRKD
jgi:hypothetical protein